VVGRHHPHGLGREQPSAVDGSFVEQHEAEAVPVVDGRDEPAGSGRKRRRGRPLAGLVDLDQVAGAVAGVAVGEPVDLLGGDVESGVGHPERFEQPLGQEVGQGKVSRSRTVIGRAAGTTSSSGLGGVRTTDGEASSGNQGEIGSSSAMRRSRAVKRGSGAVWR
jgi:hypothetical protein